MSVYYPQGKMVLKVLWEDFNASTNAKLQKIQRLAIIARRVNVHIQDYTHADTFDCEIDYKNFPFDPRCIRACGVTIFMEDQEQLFDSDNNQVNLIPSDENAVFQGFVDDEHITFDEDHRVVRMEGRDFTGIFLDTPWRGETVDTTTPLDSLITNLLKDLSQLKKVVVDNRTGETLPTIAQFAPNFETQEHSANPKQDQNYWDLIQDLVARAGLIAYIEIDKLVISKPRALYNEKQAKQFIYGRNLKTLEFKRKLGRMKGLNIRCTSFDFKNKIPQEAKIPKESKAEWAKGLGIGQAEAFIPQVDTDGTVGAPKPAPYLTFRLPNLVKEQLIEVGQKIYEELSRQQLEGSLSTKEMCIPDKQGNHFDSTKIRVGTPIHIDIDQGDMAGLDKLTSVSARQRFLIARAYDSDVAAALAEVLGKFKLIFYTKSVQFSMDEESGFAMKLEFLNFIEVSDRILGNG